MKLYRLIAKNVCLLGLLFLTASCKDDVIIPQDTLPPGKRNYTWEYYDLGSMFSQENRYQYLGGTGPDNVWISGDGSFYKSLIHYDGNSLSQYDLNNFTSIPQSPFSTPGSNTTWFSTTSGLIFKESGHSLSLFQKLDSQEKFPAFIESFYGSDENNLLGAGVIENLNNASFRGCVWKFKDNKWTAIDTLSDNSYFYEIRTGAKEGDIAYILSFNLTQNSSTTVSIYKYDFNNFQKIYSGEPSGIATPEILSMQGKVYFYINKQLLHFENNTFVVVKDFSEYNVLPHKIFGKNLKDLFLPSEEGIYHYNGTDVQLLYKYPETGTLWRGLIFENEVFFLLRFAGKITASLIHGKTLN